MSTHRVRTRLNGEIMSDSVIGTTSGITTILKCEIKIFSPTTRMEGRLKRACKREFAMQTIFGTRLYQRADDRVSKIIFSRLSFSIVQSHVLHEIAHLSRIERCRRFISIAPRYVRRHVPIARAILCRACCGKAIVFDWKLPTSTLVHGNCALHEAGARFIKSHLRSDVSAEHDPGIVRTPSDRRSRRTA